MEIIIRETAVKGVLTRSNLPVADSSVNPYVGCAHGCKYCYANKNPLLAFQNYKLHDPASPLLLGHLRPEDTIAQGAQKSFRKEARHG